MSAGQSNSDASTLSAEPAAQPSASISTTYSIRLDSSVRGPDLDYLRVDGQYATALCAGTRRLPTRVRRLDFSDVSDSDLLVCVVAATQPLAVETVSVCC
jgi:hypothetical protein